MQVSFDSLVIYFREKTSTILLIAAALVQELDIPVPDLDWPWKPTIETFYSDRISWRGELRIHFYYSRQQEQRTIYKEHCHVLTLNFANCVKIKTK